MQMKHPRKIFKPLQVTPAKRGSGLSDVSENHDYYLALDLSAKLARSKPRDKITAPAPSPQSRTSKK